MKYGLMGICLKINFKGTITSPVIKRARQSRESTIQALTRRIWPFRRFTAALISFPVSF